MPVARVLSMMLSLGGNIVPTEASGYQMKAPRFSYGGLVASRSKENDAEEPDDFQTTEEPDSQVFANMVERRAKDPTGGQKFVRVWYGIILQLCWIGVVMTACWFAGSGSILVWWCKGWGWMWLWYLTLAASSILENYAGVPFTDQWTLRVSRAPRTEESLSDEIPGSSKSGPTVQVLEEIPLVRRTASGRSTEILDVLRAGFNCQGQVIRDGNEPWSSSRVPFYVIISVEGISRSHATLRVFSKAITIGVYVTGTAIFASTQLLYMSVAVTVLCLVLSAGIFGRVIAMYMASEMMKTKPVLHRVVKSRGLAAEYIDRILNIDGLAVEVMGHVILNGRCIERYNQIFRLSNWFGLLAGPYDINRLTIVTQAKTIIPVQPIPTYIPPSPPIKAPVTKIFSSDGNGLENLRVRSIGHILATPAFSSALLFGIDPLHLTDVLVHDFTFLQNTLGITELAPYVFYTLGQVRNGTGFSIVSVDMRPFAVYLTDNQ
ncbi:MAG: hypothetical protein Q9199_001983 [Rusavskia elegans]